MTFPPRPTRLIPAAVLACLAAVSPVSGALMVQWGPGSDIVSGAQNLGGGNSGSLDLGNPSNPTIGSSYYENNTGASPVFYSSIVATEGVIDYRLLDGGGGNDEIRLGLKEHFRGQQRDRRNRPDHLDQGRRRSQPRLPQRG